MPRFNRASFFQRWSVTTPTSGALGVGLLAALAGCSGGPSRVTPPNISPSGAASEAMTAYDQDGDGFIAGAELDGAPSLKAAMGTLDTNNDGKVSESEIEERIDAWLETNVGITMTTARVTMDGKPVEGAKVTFEPEAFLGDGVKTAIGVTGGGGNTEPSIPKEQRPSADWPPGMQYGFYKIRVTKEANGAESIPAKYNTETTLGHEVSRDDAMVKAQLIKLDLTSK